MFGKQPIAVHDGFWFASAMDDRLNKLEELFSNQTHTIEQMSLEMFQQQKELTALKLQIRQLEDKIESIEAAAEIGGQERPPHY